MVKSAYIHIPFCNNICSYCDFCKLLYNKNFVKKYLDALEKEITNNYKNEILDTIYVGGGTPSSLSVSELNKLFSIIKIFKLSKEYDELELEQAEIMIKYEGYIRKTRKEAEKMKKLENKKIPKDIDYDKVPNLASEARIKLKEVRPESFGQALRISGVNPSDVSILSVYMKRYFNE